MNGTCFFTAADGTHGDELWKSDGTVAGTLLVADIRPGVNGSFPSSLTNVNGTLFFCADDGTTGRELWALAPDKVPAANAWVRALLAGLLVGLGGWGLRARRRSAAAA